MNVFRPIGVAGLAWRSVFAVADHRGLWAPVAVVAAAQALVLFLLVRFHEPLLVRLAGPLVVLLGGEAATHYPGHFVALPAMFDRASLVIDILLAWLLLGVTTLRFATAFGLAHEADERTVARGSAVRLGAIAALIAVAHLGAGAMGAGGPVAARLGALPAQVGTLLLVIVVRTLVVYAAPFIVLRGRTLGAALVDSVELVRHSPWAVLILVAVPTAAMYPLSASLRALAPAASQRPEWIAAVLWFRIVVGALLTFMLLGSTTRLFLSRTRALR